MNDPKTKPTPEELIKLLPTSGWVLNTDDKTDPEKDSTLEELVRKTHTRHEKGEHPGLISRIETVIELDLIQLQHLWEYLGLPM